MRTFSIGKINFGPKQPLFLIAGPCVIENEKIVMETADALKNLCEKFKMPLIFKSSYDKANRTSVRSFRGPGLKKGLAILAKIREQFEVPVLSDVHTPQEAREAAGVLDILQIPALLCRQTELLLAAAQTGKPVNIKKGQFMAPGDMGNVIQKMESTGCQKVLLTERGVTFGYNNLISDMRSLVIMKQWGYPVIFDATHSVQLPGGAGHASEGQREFVAPLARAATAVGCDGLFIEVHPEPNQALSDGPTMVSLKELPGLIEQVSHIRASLEFPL